MIILPAIDLIGGQCVRLYQGDYAQKEVVAASVEDTIQAFTQAGAEWIHMVDLDGAKSGKKENADVIVSMVQKTSANIEVGGGIRTMEDISFYLEHGIKRVILGTAAINNPELLQEALEKYGDKIAVGMDCKDGYACASGWIEKSDLFYIDFAKRLADIGVKNIIFTDISKDGTMNGPNLEMLKNLKNSSNADITASGGIKNIEHIRQLKDLDVYGAITGKAMYAGTLNLQEAIQLCREAK